MQQTLEQITVPRLIPLSKFNDFVKFPSVGSLRQSYFYNTDGFADMVVKKISKRLYIDIEAFYKWVDTCNK